MTDEFLFLFFLAPFLGTLLLKLSNADGSSPLVQDERELYRIRGTGGCGGRRFRPSKAITTVLEEHPNLDYITKLIKEAGLWGMLNEDGLFTLFAPKDIAFDVETELVRRIHQPQYSLHAKSLVNQHIVSGRICAAAFENGEELEALSGDSFLYGVGPDREYLYGEDKSKPVPIDDVNIQAKNGIIHTVDRFILPGWVSQYLFDLLLDDEFSTMKGLVSRANAEAAFKYLPKTRTVFAPTDTAFQDLSNSQIECLYGSRDATTSLLLSHVVDGLISTETVLTKEFETLVDGVTLSVISDGISITVNGNTVVDSDNLAYNGILHGIETVLLSDSFGCEFKGQAVQEGATVLETLKEEGMITLLNLIERAGLGPLLSNPSADITIFAPVEDAFQGLSPKVLFCLTRTDAALSSLLRYHIVDGLFFSADLKVADLFPTYDADRPLLVNGLTANDGLTQINNAGILEGDIIASNGVIHKISRVIHATGAECM